MDMIEVQVELKRQDSGAPGFYLKVTASMDNHTVVRSAESQMDYTAENAKSEKDRLVSEAATALAWLLA